MHEMRAGGYLKPGCKLARERRAADSGLRLQHEYGASAARQHRGTHQPIVAAADHDAVIASRGGWLRHHQCTLPRSLSTARAALAPGAPMTPPPGCVLEP